MRISYKALFSVECLHGYFSDHVCKTLALRPTPAWEPLRQRHQLLFRPSAGGGTVYYREQSESDLRRLYGEVTPFAFTLTSTDPLFDLYTDGGVTDEAPPGESVRHFSNRDTHVADVHGQPRLLLHPPGAPCAQPPLRVRSSLFTHHFDRPAREVAIQVLDAADRPAWETRTPAFDVHGWPVDLRGQPPGRYRLSVEGTVVLDFYLSDAPAARHWGVVEIVMKEASSVPTFTISLASRQTVWRYYIFDRPQEGSPYAGYEVVGVRKRSTAGGDSSGNGDIRFARRADAVTVNGRTAFVFESMQAVPLSEVPAEDDCLFTFKANGGSDRGGRPIKLPFAQPSATRLDAASGGAHMCSEIFVYL
jgi:hypothetical protein